MTDRQAIIKLKKYTRAANYLSVIQIYLQNNFLLKRSLQVTDIKPRLLGHWGTCPGINFVYAHLNYFIQQYQTSVLFVLGPGHGFPALQANLFLENTLCKFYPQATHTADGIGYIAKNFSWPCGFPSHAWPGTPGTILEGGELGYALATAYGAILDNPSLIAACLIGDGEAETGTTAASWHLNKFVHPEKDGFVLPILHLNGYKISGPTILARMKTTTLKALFKGYGYQPIIVQNPDIDQHMINALRQAYQLIQEIKQANKPITGNYPIIILKTPKGWTGPKRIGFNKIEGNNLSHQVVADNCKQDLSQLQVIRRWLQSYKFNELFYEHTGFIEDIQTIIPKPSLRMGCNTHAYAGTQLQQLKLPDTQHSYEQKIICSVQLPGQKLLSSMKATGTYLEHVFTHNHTIRLFSPDEIYSNKLDAVLNSTSRVFNLPIKPWDQDLNPSGKVIELLSENALQGLAQGYVLTGRHAILASYEAFIDIICSMAHQYAKFLFQAAQYPWRGSYGSLNYILTSSGWRQEHNGFSHQNPGFISSMLQTQYPFIKAYFPPDAQSTIAVLDQTLNDTNTINLIIADKRAVPLWLSDHQAQQYTHAGIAIWEFASDPEPDIVFAAIGDHMTVEVLATIQLLKQALPMCKLRFVSITALNGHGIGRTGDLTDDEFITYFTLDKPIIINFHGYPTTMQAYLFNKPNPQRCNVYGYIERGSTTTPFDMLVRNKTDRYHLAITALKTLTKHNIITNNQAAQLITLYSNILHEHRQFIIKHGFDPKPIANWKWHNTSY